MGDWTQQVADAKRDYIPRMESGQDRIIAALYILADGNEQDVSVGEIYLGHLKNIKNRWHEKYRALAQAEAAGNPITALQFVRDLGVLVDNMEGLAGAAESRAKSVGRRPGTPAPESDTLKDNIQHTESIGGPLESEESRGLPAWVWVLPIGLAALWLIGR